MVFFTFLLSHDLQNDQTIRLLLVPKREMLNRFREIVRQKEVQQTIAKEIALTSIEVDFLNDHPIIRVHNEMDSPPFNFYENGVPKGLSIDYMNPLTEKAGITLV